ncbi:MAG: hypothetical protein M1444_01180 [Patescibacteria group bacterium]|nr:hypothetical protein [Patescibacteria group bacterium]
MEIEDFEILIKKYDKEKNFVILNLLIKDELEVRGFICRYTTTKNSPMYPVWIVSPPSVKGRGKHFFWIINLKNPALWQKLQEKMIEMAKDYTDKSL